MSSIIFVVQLYAMENFILPVVLFSVIAYINFFYFLFSGKQLSNQAITRVTECWVVCLAPVLFLGVLDFNQKNDCCYDSAVFSPEHRASIYLVIAFCMAVYFYSSYRKRINTPVIEVLLNAILILGFVLNVFIAFQVDTKESGSLLPLIGSLPILMFFIMTLHRNQHLIQAELHQNFIEPKSKIGKYSKQLILSNHIFKYPVLFVVAFPVIVIIMLLLFVFGQKPDSLIRAFTDTYKHGFSQLDYMCDNVQCGGHYLCSVAANGHKIIVKPKRLGERNGNKIICNRQLLAANAFEELIEQKIPLLHKIIRRNYNKVGNVIHRYYSVFNNKFFADVIYILMKPFEWGFILIIYTFDKRPENRIAKQYLSKSDRIIIDNLTHQTALNDDPNVSTYQCSIPSA